MKREKRKRKTEGAKEKLRARKEQRDKDARNGMK